MIFDWIDEHKKLSVLTFIIIVLGFPLLVNQLSLWEAKCDVFGYPSDWLSFWGTYLAAIASFGMIIISAISIHRNSDENKQNRENNKAENQFNRLQNEKLRAQEIELKWFEDLKNACIKLDIAFNNDDVILLEDIDISSELFNNKVTQLLTRMNEAYFNFRLTIDYHGNVVQQTEVQRLRHFVAEYISLLGDLNSLFVYGYLLKEQLNNIDLQKEEIEANLKRYILDNKNKMDVHEVKQNRVWNLLLNNRYDRLEYINEVLNIMCKRIDNFNIIKVREAINMILKAEYAKIKSIHLNDTEQDK